MRCLNSSSRRAVSPFPRGVSRTVPTCQARCFSTRWNLQSSRDESSALPPTSSVVRLATSEAPLQRHAKLKTLKPRTTEEISDEPPEKVKVYFERDDFISTEPIVCAGLVRSIRKQKKVAFANVSDGSTLDGFQAVLTPDQAKDLQNGSYVELEGIWKESQGASQSFELAVGKVLRHGTCDPAASPIQKKAMSVDHLRTYPHLRLRLPLYSLLARTRACAIQRAHMFYGGTYGKGDEGPDIDEDDPAIFTQPPLITSSDCEGAGETFTIIPKPKDSSTSTLEQALSTLTTSLTGTSRSEPKHYFKSQKYLTVSSQLHLEAFSAELGNVWTLSPTFRAEESDTSRHLSEFWMLESEFRTLDNLEALTDRMERLIRFITNGIFETAVGEDLKKYHADSKHQSDDGTNMDLEKRWESLYYSYWERITYADAISALSQAFAQNPNSFTHEATWSSGLSLEHEKWIVENLGGGKPIFVSRYPKEQKPFYMLDTPADQLSDPSRPTVECFDLLLPYGICEVAGGSLRHHDLEKLIGTMREKGLLRQSTSNGSASDEVSYPFLKAGESLGTLQWYADLRRFGSGPHGGFGLGLDRLIMYVTGVSHVRDVVPFPRTFGTAHC